MDIFSAAKIGDTAQVVAILTAEPERVNRTSDRQRTALHYACREGHADTVLALLEAGADTNCLVYPNKEITLPRTLASERGHDNVVAVLDDWSVRGQPDTASSDGEDVCAAASAGDLERLGRLLARNIDSLNATDGQGNTALHRAVEQRHRHTARFLLDLGADTERTNTDALRPLHLAFAKNPFGGLKSDLATAGLLVGHGAQSDFWIACALGDLNEMEKFATAAPEAIHKKHPSHPLTIASMLGQLEAVTWLLQHGADPDAPRILDPKDPVSYKEHGAPLLFATINQHREVVRALLEAGADPNTTLMATANAASEAYQNGFDDIAADLFKYGGIPDTSACLARGNMAAVMQAFHYDPERASKQLLTKHDPDIVRICLQHNPQLTPAEQFKALFDLMRENSDDIESARKRAHIMGMLLEYGFDPNVRDQENMSLLHRTVGCMWRGRWMNSQEVMIEFSKVLLSYGADINPVDDDLRSTPIAWHARYGHDLVVAYLLSQGA